MATAAEYFEQMKTTQSKALEMLGHPMRPNHAAVTVGARALTNEPPGIPTIAELKDLNRRIHDDAGTPERYRLDQPAALATCLDQAVDAYAHDVDAIIHVAGLLAYGIASAQAFCDGNRRTAYFATQSFLTENSYSFLTSQRTSDHSLARKLNQVVEPRQKILHADDFTILFANRLRRREHPDVDR